MKILVTGFEPFGNETINPSWQAVSQLPDVIDTGEIIKLELPVEFNHSAEVLEEAMDIHMPDAVICVGQAGGRSAVSVEKVAINLQEARIPDNAGHQPTDIAVKSDGDTAYFSTLPVKEMVKNIHQAGIPAAVSYTAGTYVCNDLMYQLLYLGQKKYPDLMGGFIHVPFIETQAIDKPAGTPFMSLESITKALEAAIRAVIQKKTGSETEKYPDKPEDFSSGTIC